MTAAAGRWRYDAEDPAGRLRSGVLVAPDLDAAVRLLKKDRLQPVCVEPLRASPLGQAGPSPARLGLAELARLCRRMSDLLHAGLSVSHALKLCAEQARGKERVFLEEMRAHVRAGLSLSEASGRASLEAPRLFRSLIEAGENLGALGAQFARLASHYEESLRLRREIAAQLVYPVALLVLVLATLIFLSFVVLPQFESIFRTAAAEPPAETRFVLAAGALIRDYWAAAPLLAFAGALLLRLFARRNPGLIETGLVRAPAIGRIIVMNEAGRYFRTLSTLLEGGMPLARAMPLAQASVGLAKMRARLEAAEAEVRTGGSLGAALRGADAVPKELVSFIEIGDETGALAAMSGQAAALAENVVAAAIKRATALLAPVLTAIAGLLTAGVIAAVMSGVLSLNEAVY